MAAGLVVVVDEEEEEEDKLEKGEEASRQVGEDKSFLSVPRLLCVMVEEKDEASTRNDAVVVVLVLWGLRGRQREAILGIGTCVRGVRGVGVLLMMLLPLMRLLFFL